MIGLTVYLEKSNGVSQYTEMFINTHTIYIKIYIMYTNIYIYIETYSKIFQKESSLWNTREH